MKTLRLLLLFLIITGSKLSAQSWHAGVYSGLNMASLEMETIKTDARQFSFSMPVGLTVTKTLNKHYALQTEVNYFRMGERINGMQQLTAAAVGAAGLPSNTLAFASLGTTTSLHYLQVPVLVKATIRVHPSVTYYALIGPSLGILLSGNTTMKGNSLVFADMEGSQPLLSSETHTQQTISLNNRFSIQDQLRTCTISGVGAAGLQVNDRNGNSFFLETRLTAGLTNIYKNAARYGENQANSLSFLLGYSFSF